MFCLSGNGSWKIVKTGKSRADLEKLGEEMLKDIKKK